MIGPLLQLALVPARVALDVIFTAPDHEQEDTIPFRDHAYFVMCGDCEKEDARRRAVSQPWAKREAA
jgi:hypothetical protein